jgi:hypothetical protein
LIKESEVYSKIIITNQVEALVNYPTLFIFEPHLGQATSLCFVPQLIQ